jgi:hypothetical protein
VVAEAAETVGGETAAAVSWAWARRRRPLSEEVGTVQTRSARGSDRAADGWAPRGFIFPIQPKLAKIWNLKQDALAYSKNSQILYSARLGHCEQFSQLFLHPILNKIRVKIPGTDSPFESLMNF